MSAEITALPALASPAQAILERPRPPADLVSVSSQLYAFDHFEPAPEVVAWIRAAFLDDQQGPLYTDEHAHLASARLACLWTNTENARHGRRIVGQAEMPGRGGGSKGGKWAKARAEQQLREWFGHPVPDFLITLDAFYADECDDAAFCALIDHELCHCAQATDEYGMPRFSKETGEPIWTIRGHDVEEFVSVVRRFGIEAAGEQATNMVIAAANRPEVAAANLAKACGTCAAKAA